MQTKASIMTKLRSFLQRAAAAGLVLGLAACASNRVQFPDSTALGAHPVPLQRPSTPPTAGSIYQSAAFRPLFEDTRARFPGDTLVITLSERTTASNSNSDNATRSASVATAVTATSGTPLGMLAGTNIGATGSSKLDNKDANKADNLFTGTITVTVTEVLPSGNLRVFGDKQIGINDAVDTLRFSGIVNPATIAPGNTVASAQVAEARLETVSRTNVDAARVAGFLGRFFLSFVPFR